MFKIFAPAKINLHLHVTGKRGDGYHLLDSLVCFSNIGDELIFEHANELKFRIEGEFASSLNNAASLSNNTVVKAIQLLAQHLKCNANVQITLKKNLPFGAGIGGGSADAAACLKGLKEFWSANISDKVLKSLALQIGSDVPVCLEGTSAIMRDIGNIIQKAPIFSSLPAILIWPNKHASTQEVYKNLKLKDYSAEFLFKEKYDRSNSLIDDLKKTRNDLENSAIELFPEIYDAFMALQENPKCKLVRMSGSGSTVFGIFDSENEARDGLEKLQSDYPDWWIQYTWLNRD